VGVGRDEKSVSLFRAFDNQIRRCSSYIYMLEIRPLECGTRIIIPWQYVLILCQSAREQASDSLFIDRVMMHAASVLLGRLN
jgi:hypothetical protein